MRLGFAAPPSFGTGEPKKAGRVVRFREKTGWVPERPRRWSKLLDSVDRQVVLE